MSRQIDLTKPLSDEDRQYLLDRSRLADIAIADGNEASTHPDDSIPAGGEQNPTATDAARGQNPEQPGAQPSNTPNVLASPATEHQTGEDAEGDNYDDEEAWPYADLKEEIGERDATDKPALNSKREDLVSWLRMDDAR